MDIFAPGSSITSAWHTSDTATSTISGTSMASPHVAGAAALILEAAPAAAPATVGTAIVDDATAGKVTSPGTESPNRLLYTAPSASPPPPPPPPPPPTDSTCPAPTNVSASRLGSSKAAVSWTHPGAPSFSVWLTRPEWGGAVEYSSDGPNPRTLFGLVASSSYGTFVTARCGTVVSAPSATVTIPAVA